MVGDVLRVFCHEIAQLLLIATVLLLVDVLAFQEVDMRFDVLLDEEELEVLLGVVHGVKGVNDPLHSFRLHLICFLLRLVDVLEVDGDSAGYILGWVYVGENLHVCEALKVD